MESSSGGSKRSTVIRANPSQTVVLKAAFALTDKPSPEQIQSLSDETKLPPKWINLWFGRQRAQARKKKVSTADNPDLDESSSNIGLSAQKILEVKSEYALEGTVLGSVLSSSSIAQSTADFVNLSESTSSTAAMAVDSATSAVEPAKSGKRKRQRKGQSNEKGRGKNPATSNDKKVVITRALRSNKKDGASTNTEAQVQATQPQSAAVKRETLESSFTLRYTPSPVPMSASVNLVDAKIPSNRDMDSDAKSSNPTNPVTGLAAPTMSKAAHSQMLLNIAPPQRSPISAANTTIYRRTEVNNRSSLSVNQFAGIQAPSPSSRPPRSGGKMPTERNPGFRGPFNRSTKPERSGLYQPGPTFHTQFQNNGPWDYTSSSTMMVQSGSNLQAPYIPMAPGYFYDAGPVFPFSIDELAAPVYYGQSFQAAQYYHPRPLAPGFDWENHPPSSPMEFMYPSDDFDNIPQICGEEYPEQQPLVSHPLQDISMNVLNPSLAPLKHLTGILGDFKDSDGTYSSLFDERERGKLMDCLLDETLVETNPFQAAMGLSLLSKVGHQWEY